MDKSKIKYKLLEDYCTSQPKTATELELSEKDLIFERGTSCIPDDVQSVSPQATWVDKVRELREKQKPIYEQTLATQAAKGVEKYFKKGVYDDTLLLKNDIKKINNYIKNTIAKNPKRNYFVINLSLRDTSWLDGCFKLYQIYNKYKTLDACLSKNEIFQKKYGQVISSTFHILAMGFAQYSRIPYRNELPDSGSESPDCGVCLRFSSKYKYYFLHIWF